MEHQEALNLPQALRPRQPASAALHAYWDRLRAGDAAPHRRDLRPEALGATLTHIFIVEEDCERAAFRLAGSGVFDIFQRELRGLDWLTLFEEETRPLAQSVAASVLRRESLALLQIEGRTARHRTVMLEIMLLPLRTEPGEPNRLVGSLVARDEPYWLGAQPVVELSALHAEVAPAAGSFRAAPPLPRPALAEGPIRRLRHLALYLGGRSG